MFCSLKQIAKSSSSSSSTSSYYYYRATYTQPYSTSLSTAAVVPANDVIISFKQWFKSGDNVLLSRIFQILRSTSSEMGPHHHHHNKEELPSSADVALTQLNLRLNEAFVLDVLRYGDQPHDVLSCLKFFDWAGRHGGGAFRHTPATFAAIFKILSRAKLMSLMLEFLASFQLSSAGHGGVRFHDTLVMGYAVAGKAEVALRLFGVMRFQGLDLNAFAYHVLLNALVENNCFDAGHVIADHIIRTGNENDVTRTIMLKWYCKQNLLSEAEEYLRKLAAAAEITGRMVSVVVQALCKRKLFEQAGNLMDEFRESGVVSMDYAYSVWIRELVKARKLDEALEFLQRKKSLEGYVPGVFRYNILIRRLLKESRLEEAGDMLLEMKECDIAPDKVTMSTALCFFCKAGMADVALELYNARFEFGLSPNSMAYTYLINTFCGEGSTDQAYRVLQSSAVHGFFPGKKTFSILADALCREGKLDKMRELVIFALEHNLIPAAFTYDKFITSLCKTNRVEDGYLMHEERNRMDGVGRETAYSNLVYGFCKLNKGDIAARLLIEMQELGLSPDRGLFREVICCVCQMGNPDKQFFNFLEMHLSCLKPTCSIYNNFMYGAGHAKRPELAREVYERMQRSGIKPDLSSDILVLVSYIKCGRVSDALNFFADLRGRRQIKGRLYSSMIVGLCEAKRADFALDLLREMREKKVVPTLVCYEYLIQLHCWNKEFDTAINLITDLEYVGRHITTFIGNILLLHSLKDKEFYDAWVRLREVQMETSGISKIGLLIAAFSGRITVSNQIVNFEELIADCFQLNDHTYNLLIRRFTKSNMDHATALFYRMCQRGLKPNRWTYEILVHGFLMHKRTDDAKRWLTAMSLKGFYSSWQSA